MPSDPIRLSDSQRPEGGGCRKCGCTDSRESGKPGVRICRHCGALVRVRRAEKKERPARGILCPECGAGGASVIKTTPRQGRISRRRECRACGSRWSTDEK